MFYTKLDNSIPGARELGQDIANHVKDDNPHNLALHDHDSAPWVHGNATRVLKDIGAELPHELAVLVEYLNLRNTFE